MCTLVALHRCVPDAQLLVAANRDEYYARPAEGPGLRHGPHAPSLAPLDVRAGGTWLGVSAGRLFAAVTNRPCPSPDPARRSRGMLVFEALSAESAEQAADRLAALPARAYNPFNLFVADAEAAFLITYQDAPHRIELEPGVHVIGNAHPLDPPTDKLARLRERARLAAAAAPDAVLDALADLCRSHEGHGDPLASACVHTPGYGTRSSTLLRLSDFATDDVFRFADGAPCETEYQDVTPLLRALGGGAPRAEGERAVRKAS